MAQPGSALAWGASGQRFKSARPDHRCLFLYLSAASGHQRAADAVRAALAATYGDRVETVGADVVATAYPIVGRVISRTYLEMLKRIPQLWGYLYDNPDVVHATKEVREFLSALNNRKLQALLREFRPGVVVCTQAVPCNLVASEKRSGRLDVPLIACITDFAAHAYWASPGVDLYVVATEESRRALVERGVRPSRIRVLGVPIHPDFAEPLDRIETRRRLGLKTDRPVILVMGGSQGLGPMADILSELARVHHPHQTVVITGLNARLRRDLRKRFGTGPNVIMKGYTHDIPHYMAAADLLITKPGGLTSAEALAARLPMILLTPIPGQETRNTQYLLRSGAAQRVLRVGELPTLVDHLLRRPSVRARMGRAAEHIARPHAATDIATLIYEVLESANGNA